MPARMPYIKWFPADWLAATVMLTPATRGIWFDLLNAMWQMDRADRITGTVAELARAGRCSIAEMSAAIAELSAQKVANVTKNNGRVTVVCRRFKRANAERVRAAEGMRVTRKLRKSYGEVTEKLQRNITEDILHKESVTDVTHKESAANGGAVCGSGDGESPNTPCQVFRGYPDTADAVIELAERAGAICTPEQAESYLLSRQAVNWVMTGGRPIRNVGADIKRFLLTWQTNHAEAERRNATPRYGKPPIDYDEAKRRGAELRAENGDDPRFDKV